MGQITIRRGIAGVLAGMTLIFPAIGHSQESMPSVITLVVPFSAGGGVDQLARGFAQTLESQLPGTSVIVDNKPGANGAIAARQVARHKADGSMLLVGTSSTHALGPLVAGVKAADIAKEFSPVSLLATTANALAVNYSSEWRSLDEFIGAARENPKTYGTFGTGSSAHLYGLILAESTDSKLQHVPYKGSSNALTDLLGGHIDSVLLTTSAMESLKRSDKIRVLAVTGSERATVFPDVMTFEEQNIKGLDFNGWFGLFAPLGTPEALRRTIAEIAARVKDDPIVRERLAAQGYEWVGSNPEKLQQVLQETLDVYKKALAAHPDGISK